MKNRQAPLLLERGDRLAALVAIDGGGLGAGRRAWANVIDLLTQIELCTGRDGCFCYVETLAARMMGKRGVSRATFFRARRLAQDVGLLTGLTRVNRQGQQSNEWRIDWTRVSMLACAAGWKKTETHPPATETHRCQTETPPCQTETPLIGIALSSVLSVQDESSGGRNETTGWNSGEILGNVRRLCRLLGRMNGPGDWSLAVKAVRLAHTIYSEAWLWGAADVAKDKRRPWAYLQTVLADQARQIERRLSVDLARLTIPADLVRPISATGLEEIADRLCTVGERETPNVA